MTSSLRIIYALIVFILGIVLLSSLTVLLIYENRQSQLSFAEVTQSSIIKNSLEKIRAGMAYGDALHKGFLISHDSASLKAFSDLPNAESEFDYLDSLVQKDITQKKSLMVLRRLFREQKTRQTQILQRSARGDYRSSGGFSMDLEASNHTMLQALQLIDHMQSHEDRNLVRRQDDAKRHSVLPALIGIGISIFAIIIFILAFYFTNAELKKSIHLNDELEAKNIQLEKYTQELSSFTNIASHDMQEPLRKIELFISMIEDREKENLSPNASQYFEKIKDSVGRMRHLFFNILSFSMTDQVRNVKEQVDLNHVLAETLESLKVYVKDTNAVITNESLPVVVGVRHQLVQVFQNLISNSLKYKRPNVIPEITITCGIIDGRDSPNRELSKERKYYRIDFQDNGTGFDQRYVDRIFDIFQRHVRNENNGVGIGLSICKKIAQNHSGTITAETEINKGSLFSVFLPFTNVEVEADPVRT